MRDRVEIKPPLFVRHGIRVHVCFLQGFIGKFMGQLTFADDYFSLYFNRMGVAQHFYNAAFGVAFPAFKISDFNDNRVSVPGTAGVFTKHHDVEKKTFVFRDHQAGLSSSFKGSYQDGCCPLEDLYDNRFGSAAFFGNKPEEYPVSLMGASHVVWGYKRVLAQRLITLLNRGLRPIPEDGEPKPSGVNLYNPFNKRCFLSENV